MWARDMGGSGPIGGGAEVLASRDMRSAKESPRSSTAGFAAGGPGSDGNTSVQGAPYSRQQAGFDRRIAWLEEDVAMLHRRFRDDTDGGAGGDDGFRAWMSRMDAEITEERAARARLEARLDGMLEMLAMERRERQAQLKNFSSELEHTLRDLIGRIDDGLSVGASASAVSADATEERLRTLIKRIDEGLLTGAAALQDTLSLAGATTGEEQRMSQPPTPLGTGLAASLPAPAGNSPQSEGGHSDGAWRPAQLPQTSVVGPIQEHFDASAPTVHIVRPQPQPLTFAAVQPIGYLQPVQSSAAMSAVSHSVNGAASNDDAESDALIRDWDRLRQENSLLKERRAQLQGRMVQQVPQVLPAQQQVLPQQQQQPQPRSPQGVVRGSSTAAPQVWAVQAGAYARPAKLASPSGSAAAAVVRTVRPIQASPQGK